MELEYNNNYATWLLASGITPSATPINLRGVIHQIIQNIGTGASSGITQLTGDVTTASGSGSQAATLVGTTNVESIISANTTVVGNNNNLYNHQFFR